MPDDDYASALHRAAEICRELATMGKRCGQHDGGPEALIAASAVILAEADEEPTEPTVVVLCQLCGQLVKTT